MQFSEGFINLDHCKFCLLMVIFVCVGLCLLRRARERSALFNRMVDNRQVLFMTLMICCYGLLVCSYNILLVVFELFVKYLVEPTKNPTSRDSAAQRIDDNFRKGADPRKEN
jgi:predicted membrane protein